MSLLWTLRKFVDPVEHLADEGERLRQLKPEEEADPGSGPPGPQLELLPLPERTYRCRVCGLESQRSTFCSHCLAATMEPVRGR